MKVVHSLSELQSAPNAACVAIGMFDGVHLGHQQVIRQTVTDAHQHEATSLCVTFDRHPATIVNPSSAPRLIQSLPQRLAAIETLDIDATLLLEFNESLRHVAAANFIENLQHGLGDIKSICVGAKFVFGHDRQGDVEFLRTLGDQSGFRVHGLAAVALDSKTISSTRIREAITSGRLDGATQMLGREYALAGKVIRGDKRGRELSFPTANLDCADLCLPPHGVYAAHATVNGHAHRAAVNIGHRPTVADITPTLHIEAHLLDFEGDLYGQHMELTFVEKLRDEQKFDSLNSLKAQISTDIQSVRNVFAQL